MLESEKQLEILTLFSFFVSAAGGCLREPRLYGPLRLVSAMDKLYELLRECYGYDNSGLKTAIDEAQEQVELCLEDETALAAALDKCTLAITRLLKQQV